MSWAKTILLNNGRCRGYCLWDLTGQTKKSALCITYLYKTQDFTGFLLVKPFFLVPYLSDVSIAFALQEVNTLPPSLKFILQISSDSLLGGHVLREVKTTTNPAIEFVLINI